MGDSGIIILIAQAGGGVASVLGSLALLFLVKCASIFREETRKIDVLVGEYVRCRDYLLGTRRPSAASGWRTAEGGAFREAWQNFNTQIDLIRERYDRRIRPLRLGLFVIVAVLLLNAVIYVPASHGRFATDGAWVSGSLSVLAWALVPAVAWMVLLVLTAAVTDRTEGNKLVAPWPAEGGTPEKSLSTYEKFLPIEMKQPEVDAAPEASL